jgi:predicted Na+-dependent transporter
MCGLSTAWAKRPGLAGGTRGQPAGPMRWVSSALRSPLALVSIAAVDGLVWPSAALADRSDLVLAALVLAVALTIDPARLCEAAAAWQMVAGAALLPLAVLLPVAIGLGALFGAASHDGLIALGLASSEVATAGLVALAGGDAALALAVVTVSLALTALAAPVIARLLVDSSIEVGDLIGRFSLVVLVPLVVGLTVRARSGDARLESWGGRAATPVLAVLVYAALGDLGHRSALGGALSASLLFLGASVALALVLRPLLGDLRTGGFVFALRDFAVAATLAGQFDTAGAAVTPAVYGVLMLLLATAASSVLGRAGPRAG